MDINKVSHSISSQSPDFLRTEYPLFNKFIEYYYRSQEKTGLGQNIVNKFLQYLDIDKLEIDILDGSTKIVEPISDSSDTIVVESVDQFLQNDGSIMIGDEVIYYENTTSSPNIALSPGISYDQVKLKWTGLAQLINDYDGTTVRFPLTSQSTPIPAPSAQHLIVELYNQVLVPNVDYTVDGTDIVFTTAPRAKETGDDVSETSINYLSGFIDNSILLLDNISGSFGENKTEFKMTRNGESYTPITDEYVIAIYDGKLLTPRVDYYLDKDIFIFEVAPLNGRLLTLHSIEAPIPSFGSGALGYARVNNSGELTDISINETGSSYKFENPPHVTIQGENGSGASATALVNGVKNAILLDGGRGYSDTNPPTVEIESPTLAGSEVAKLKATVTNGSVTDIEIVSSGSGYSFNPRVTFKQPGGAKLAPPTIISGSISGTITVTDGGQGYTTPPRIYVDAPGGTDGITAALQAVLTDGKITSVNVLNAGQGYTTTPRIAVIDPTGAQILETLVDGDGRVVSIELLDGGSGYEDIPSVYIVDPSGNGTGAKATAAIFNGKITDINIGEFGSGYSVTNPPTVVIQSPPEAKASVEPGLNEVTGFKISKKGTGYDKAAFNGCARAASGIVKYTESGNAVFSNNTTAAAAAVDTNVKCLDSLFVKRLLDKYTEQFLPDVPELDYKKIDVRTAIKSVKDFYSTKGTSFSVAYLFKLLYGEEVTINYPKDQITKPSAATWSIDTILRATIVSGNPVDIKDGLLTQEESIADPNVKAASALIENYISIKTSNLEIYELVLSEETIQGTFTVPYKTKLAEPLGTDNSIITVDSTIGWPERNGEFIIGASEVVQYKEKSLNQFIECTRSVNGVVEDWDSATEVSSNLIVYVNKGTAQEVVMNVVGIVDAQQTSLTNTGSYYLTGDKLTVSKLGGTSTKPELNTWLYNVKKLIEIESITYGGVNNQFATVTCSNPHGLLVGDQVTIYGANPIIYNGSFLVTSRDSTTVFQYQLPQPAEVTPQGNILVSVDLNKGKSENTAIANFIGPYTTNIQNTFFNDNYVYVASTGIPNYNIGPFPGSALLPGNQRKLNRFPLLPSTISTKTSIVPGSIGTWVNGVSIWSYKSTLNKTFGPVTSVSINNAGKDYDAASPPVISIENGGGAGAAATVTVDGSITEIVVNNGGSGYTSSPLVSIVGGGGSGAAATAIVTKGVVSRILMNSGGTGYTSQPSITIVGGGGTGATATASVRGPIQSINVTSGGANYTSTPDVTLSSGKGAVAQAIVQNGRIISIAIISAGQGYTTAPEVTIQGEGFGAVARATIDVDGENAGRVTGIEIINRGINYVQGSTIINLNSIGQDATFEANVFQWNYNLQETTNFDDAKGSVFVGLNNQYGGEYAHLSNPQRLRFILGDNLFEGITGAVQEQESNLNHSPIIGWAYDGNPIYGPYGYSDATDQSSNITRLRSSYALKTELVLNQITNPYPSRTAGPSLNDEPAGKFVEDYEYSFGSGDLDQYNGRFCKTPDFPEGKYCYFVTIDATDAGNPVFPYVIGPQYNSVVDEWNLKEDAIQQNIPTGVVRFRDPYENVDIDVERAPNASTNALTLENGDILLFEIEDENRDGIISQDETDDPDQIFEESPLQLFDYFPSVRLDSKVDIEVETITKFEDANITGFTIEDPGKSYQVDDILIFDNTDTDGTGVSARISRITGETVSSYTFENIEDTYYGVLSTSNPHNIVVGDKVFVDYTPVMDSTNKQFVVRQLKGIEEIVINQTGSGYDDEIPPTISVDGNGVSASLEAVVNQVGAIEKVNIINSGSSYTEDPRIVISHPQVFKKADYYVSTVNHEDYVKINDSYVNENKELYICGKTHDATDNEVAFVAKFSELGVKEWEKTLESQSGENYTEFIRMDVRGNTILLVGENKPNASILSAYNPDVFFAKYTQAEDGLSATIDWQRGYAGISGATRADHVTAVKASSDSRFIIGGFTNTNSANPYDAFIASIDSTGGFAAKRKIATSAKSEKLTDLIVKGDSVYFIMETADSSSATDVRFTMGKASVGTSVITVDWTKEITNSVYSFLDTSMVIDEYDEMYVTGTLRLKSNNTTKDSFWVGKFDTDGDLIWNYRYVAPTGNTITVANRTVLDIFGNLNVAYTRVNDTTGYRSVDTVKIDYTGKMLKQTNNEFNINNVEGLNVHAIAVDNSGDVYPMGQSSWNRNEFIFPFTTGADQLTDLANHYTPTVLSTGDSVRYLADHLFIQSYETASPSTWVNSSFKIAAADLGTKLGDDWTLEFMIYKNSSEYQSFSQTQVTLLSIGDATVSTGGLWLYYDLASGRLEMVITNNVTAINSAGSALQSTQTTLFADDTWQFIGVRKSGDTFTVFVNGIQVLNGTVTSTSLGNKDLHFANIPGRSTTLGQFRSNEQFQGYYDNIKLRNRAVTPTVPSDVSALPTDDDFGLAFDWVDDAFFTTYLSRYDYIDYNGWILKSDKNADSVRLGDKGAQTNTGIGFARTAVTPVTGQTLTVSNLGLALGPDGLQNLDYDSATLIMIQDNEALTYAVDTWSSRTATVPSPGSQKLSVTAKIKNRYYMKVTNTVKIDNVQELTINQSFNFRVGSKLVLNNTSGAFINSGYILRTDTDNNKVYVAVNNNAWSNDLNTGRLSTAQFSEASTYGIVGPIPSDVNEIKDYSFGPITNTTPGTFDVALNDFNLNRTAATSTGQGNLDDFAVFRAFDTNDSDNYRIRIDSVSSGSTFIPGSVVTITSSDISFNSDFTTATITNLTGVLTATVITTLEKVLQCTAVSNTDEVYIITGDRHYLSQGENIFVDGNPTREVSGTAFDEYDGSFVVDTVVSSREFIYKLPAVAQTDPAPSASSVSIFAKSPVLKMYYGHQYLFDLSHSSLVGSNLSFSKDNLFKLEYSFNSIERIGTPGVTGEGQPTPTVKLKVNRETVTNISYYFDPSRLGDESPIASSSYLDIVDSPYLGPFTVTSVSGGTITTGDNIMKFKLINEPEGAAVTSRASYSTSSKKAVGSISDIRIVNSGGFYSKLPIITGIQSTRQIERAEINEPGTEYAVGTYRSVPIQGDGEGGLVEITVADGTTDEGVVIPGQIQEVKITSPGKGYTTASIDIEAIPGILGTGLAGSGAEIDIVIPPSGSGAVVFAQGDKIGKIKKLKNNNFGYDYSHDYTLRPEITFPINAQLTSTNILDSITVTDPGSGYSQAPAVIITGGGGSGAIAEATIKNGRIDQIIVKDPGAGYSSAPTVALKSSFNYVVNVDLGLLQFAFPHGIQNGAEVTLNVVDTGDGAEFPLAAGALGRLTGTTTYYAIAGTANSLESDQLKLAITESNAELGDAIGFVNSGTGRQQVLTESFGAAAEANVITSTFLEGELVYQGDSFAQATATGYVSTNSGWQVGPRIIKIVDYDGDFISGQSITGVISKSSGIISDLNIAKGVLEIGSITKTTGQFIDDVGKPSEIIQKIQDSYYYQDFSYAVQSSVSIDDWKEILIRNAHPASFKVFGELNLNEYSFIPNKETKFELTKSVELTRDAVVPNIQSFALAEPIYSEFNNTEVLFRQKRLTSSENILTSVVQRLDDVSSLFDGERTAFPLTVNGDPVIANANQILINMNGVAQTPNSAFEVQGDSIVFAEPPQPPASVKYVNVVISQINTKRFTVTNNSGIFPLVGNTMVGITSTARLTVTSVAGQDITGYVTEGTFQVGENVIVNATGFNAQISTITDITNNGLFEFNETVTNLTGDIAKVEQINLETGQETPIAELRYTIGAATTTIETVAANTPTDTPVPSGTFVLGQNYQLGSEIVRIDGITDNASSTTIQVQRAQLGTASVSHQEDSPFYGTEIEVTDRLTLSKTTGTYQSTAGLFDIQLNDTIIGAKSGVVAQVTATSAYQDPSTNAFIEQVNISDGSSFFGLLFNRRTSTDYPNVILDDVSKSQINIVDFTDTTLAFNSSFPNNEIISNNIITYDNVTGTFQDNEIIRNYQFNYSSNTGEFAAGDNIKVRKLTFTDEQGDGFFREGDVIRTRDTKAEIIGYSQANQTVYLGKIGRCQRNGSDYHTVKLVKSTINSYNKKFGTASLALSPGTSTHTFVSGVTDAITAGGGATGNFTAASGTTYNPITGVMVIEIGTHTLTTSNTVTIADNGVTFTCLSDNNTNNYSYPRSTDPASNSALAITAVTATTITVNVGAVPVDEYATVATSTEFGFGTGDFTVELWIKPNSVASGSKVITDFRPTSSDTAVLLLQSGSVVEFQSTNGAGSITGTTNLVVDTWYHVAVVRESGVTKLYLDGVQQGSNLTDTTNYGSTRPIKIGANLNGSAAFPGYIDDLRVSTSARYTGTFTVPAMHQGDADAKLLVHFDGDYNQTYTEDWSGSQDFTNYEYFNNSAIVETVRSYGGLHKFVSAVSNTIAVDGSNETVTDATYDATTGDLVMTIGSHSYTTSSTLTIVNNGLTFSCDIDNYATNKTYPRSTDPAFGATLNVTAVTATTLTVDVGTAFRGYEGRVHRYYNAADLIESNVEFVAREVADRTASSLPFELDTANEPTIVRASDYNAVGQYSYYGYSTAVGTNKIVVGSYRADDNVNDNRGAAYIYDLDGNNEIKIEPPGSSGTNDYYGYSVGAGSSKIVVGAPYDDPNGSQSGRAYIYDEDGTNVVTLTPSPASSYEYFGWMVAAGDSKIAVSAYGDDNYRGAVYLFDTDGSNQIKVTASDRTSSDQFGLSCAIGSSRLAVGAPYDDDNGSASGSVYVYNLDGTNEVKITASDGTSNDQFGRSVAVGSNKVVVGCQYDDPNGLGSAGKVYVYNLDGTGEVIITPSDPASNDQFGSAVAVGIDKIFVAARYAEEDGQSNTGIIYSYDLDGTNEIKLPLAAAANFDYWGNGPKSMSVSSNRFVVGADNADTNNVYSSGKIAIYPFTQGSASAQYLPPIRSALNSIAQDLRNGSNSHTWDQANTFVDRETLPITALQSFVGEETSLIYAHGQTKTILSSIINNALVTVQGSHGLIQVTDTTITESDYATLTSYTPTDILYTASTGEMVITSAGHGLTTSDFVYIDPLSLTFTCDSDNNVCQIVHPRKSDTLAYNRILAISAVTTDTFTINVGASPAGQQYTHDFVSATTGAIKKSNYTATDCADVRATCDNLMDIIIDTIEEGSGTTTNDPQGDHLGVVGKVLPAREFLGGRVDAFYEVPFDVTYHDGTDDFVYAHQIDTDARYRFRDAANLLRANTAVIVDKAAADLIARYPDLAQDMPRNQGGSSTDGTLRCKTDMALIVGELAKDLEFGGNTNVVTTARFYLNSNTNELLYIRKQVWQSVYAHDRLAYYAKQAINGDLTYDNTTNIITGDWGITNDPGQCANVATAIDNLFAVINDILAPTDNDHNIAADRIYFNRDYLAEEIIGRTNAELTYTLASNTYTADSYNTSNYDGYIKNILIAIASDLQTDGNNSVITELELFLNASREVITIDGELYVFSYVLAQIKDLIGKAMENLLYDFGASTTGSQYQAQYAGNPGITGNNATAYRDTESPTDIGAVVCKAKKLLETAEKVVTPGGIVARSGYKNIGYNANYYKEELASVIGSQFGTGSWQYNSFVDELLDNIQYDLFTTDTTDSQQAYGLTVSSVVGNFIKGEKVETGGGASATVLYSEGTFLVVGAFTGGSIVIGDTLTGALTLSTCVVDAVPSVTYPWYNNISNIKTIESAAGFSSLIEGSVDNLNLFTNPEDFSQTWVTPNTNVTTNIAVAPDGTNTADKFAADAGITSNKEIYRDYSLNSFTTFDGTGTRFDSGTATFDTGANLDTQTFTASMFVKKAQYNQIRFRTQLDGANSVFFDFNLDTGAIGSLFNQSNGACEVLGHGAIPFGANWYRVYITIRFGFGFSTLRNSLFFKDLNGNLSFSASSNNIRLTGTDNNLTLTSYSYYGSSIAQGDGKIVVGAPYDDIGGQNSAGSVYVMNSGVADPGSTQIKIQSPNNTANARFGYHVAVGQNHIIVGAPYETHSGHTYAGSVYVFDLDGNLVHTLRKPDTGSAIIESYDYFGFSVAVGADKVYVGTPRDDGDVNNQTYHGSVYVFNLDTGAYESEISGSDTANYDQFGWSIAFANNKLIVGAPFDDDGGNASGTVYVYNPDGTGEVKINPATPLANRNFGRSVAGGAGKIAVGCPFSDPGGTTNKGEAFLFNLDGTGEVNLTPPSTVSTSDYFGWSVTIGEGKVAVGAYNDEDTGEPSGSGTVTVYDLDGTNPTVYTSGEESSSDQFGYSVALANGNLYAGARYKSVGVTRSGAVYIVDLAGGPGILVWGAKLAGNVLGTYTADSGEVFYANAEFNIKKYSISLLQGYIEQALKNQLVSPSENASFLKYYDAAVDVNYNADSVFGVVRTSLGIITEQLKSSTYYTTVTGVNGITLQTKVYGDRDIPVGISGELGGSDFIYATNSNSRAEIQSIEENEAKIVKVYKRFRVPNDDVVDGPFPMNQTVQKQGDASVTGVIYATSSDDNFTYFDIEVTAGTWTVNDVIEATTGTPAPTATIDTTSTIEDRLHVIDLKGGFVTDIPFKGFTSGAIADPVTFTRNEAAVTSNTGGVLTVDTETLVGQMELNSVVYPASSKEYLLVNKYAGLDLNVGDKIASTGHIRLLFSYVSATDFRTFAAGNKVHKQINGNKQEDVYGYISEVDNDNNYLYVVPVEGTFANTDVIGDYGLGGNELQGQATITTKVDYAGEGSARVQDIRDQGLNKRLYLTEIEGAFRDRDGIRGPAGYRSIVYERKIMKARVQRYFRGFDGTQTIFDLTTNNGTPYLPDPAGHMLIFVNGVLQPPGAAASYTAFSDKIQFTEAPELGASFTGFYVGKLRQLDDISFEFDSLRQSFNLKRNDSFYSLTLTDGVQSSTIRPENNIIVSVNGVLQEPGVGFEIVGSRIIFSEIPRVGSTFVAFSYVGSEADVDAEDVVPPVEINDLLTIEGETEDREVAVIESSNSLITFDYLGSVFGQGAIANANLTSGYITTVGVTSGGSGYSSRPTVRLDSISGFDGSIKALVGVGSVTVQNIGSGYQESRVEVQSTVPDDWTAPDISQYGEEIVDPEIL